MATYWEDVDAAWERAIAAGAEVVYPWQIQFYGERAGDLRDPFGQQWMLRQRNGRLSHDEITLLERIHDALPRERAAPPSQRA